jgi:hypothetical protein
MKALLGMKLVHSSDIRSNIWGRGVYHHHIKFEIVMAVTVKVMVV